jgi:hypothetical protein
VHDVEPLVLLYSPGTHNEHDDVLVLVLYEPTGQFMHELESAGLYLPATQSVQLVDPVMGLCVPAGHSEQALEPTELLNLPAGHEVHDDDPLDAL